jgi:hypothetical protein
MAARARKRRRAEARQPPGHMLPDLAGQPVDVIVNALISTLVAALRDDQVEEGADWSCAACTATIDLASHYGDPTHMAWPDPIRRLLADLIDAELAARKP